MHPVLTGCRKLGQTPKNKQGNFSIPLLYNIFQHLFQTFHLPVTKNRPTLEAALVSDEASLLLVTWKRPTLVLWMAESLEIVEAPSASLGPLGRGDDWWSVLSGLEGAEDDEDEDDEEIEDGVRDEEDTMVDGSGASSAATETYITRWTVRFVNVQPF